MKLAIMQPYLFPYVGYFQLVHAADVFVFYDDAAFIKQGWINRNRLRIGHTPRYFSVPLQSATSYAPINRTRIHSKQFDRWRVKFLRTLRESYAGASETKSVLELTSRTLDSDVSDIGSLARVSVEASFDYLGLSKEFLLSSRDFPAIGTTGQARIIEMCKLVGATHYINPAGGRHLYDYDSFRRAGVRLQFLTPRLSPYRQCGAGFVPGLSILDLLSCEKRDVARRLVEQGDLE